MKLEVKQLNKHFGSFHAVRDVNFQINEGKLVGLLGPSGGGKTSILRMIAGLETPTSGEIYLGDQQANNIPIQKREIGFVFQHYALFKHMTVFDNIAYGLNVKKKPRDLIEERVRELLKLMGLEGAGKKYPHQLSGGQRQRVAFARALAPEPRLLLLDEPFAAIDAKIRKELRSWLRDLINEVGITSIFVTHDQDEAIEVADEILIINHGQLEQQGTPWDIYRSPANAFVASFIGESNRLHNPIELIGFDPLEQYTEQHSWKSGVSIMIRPEAIEVRAKDTTDRTSAGERGIVKHVHFRGDAWYLEIALEQEILVAYQPVSGRTYETGEEVNVLIHRVLVFTPDQQTVLENEALGDPMTFYI